MKQFRFKTKLIAQFFLVAVISFSTLVGCKSYDQDIEDLNGKVTGLLTDVAALKTSVAALETSVSGMTYIKSITMGTDGKLTITPSVGSAIIYDAKSYVTYDIKLEGNNLIVNGANKGTVAIPALTFDNGLLKSGTTTVADLTSWLKSGLTVVDGFLAINGQKTSVAIPAAAGKTVKEVALDGTNVKVTYTDNTSTVFANAPIVTGTSAAGTLLVNGVDTGVKVNNTYSVIDGFLAVNGVKTTVAIPAGSSVIINKVDGVIVSATVSDGTDTFTIKLNPTNELLSSILFVPAWINNGLAAVEVGFINSITAPVGKVLFNEQNLVYRFNPTTADVSKTTWKFINTSARVDAPGQGAPGDQTTLFAVPTYTSNNDGSGTFKLKVAGTWPTLAAGNEVLIALQANGKDFYSGNASSVVSDYAKVSTTQYNAFISDAKKSSATANTYVHYRVPSSVTNPNPNTDLPILTAANDFDLVIGTPVDLDDLVWATADKGGVAERRFETYGFNDYKYQFSLPNYLGDDAVTNQNSFVTLNAENVLSVNTGSSVLDRNPVVLVKLLSAGDKLVAQSYIKFKIVATPGTPPGKKPTVKDTIKMASAISYATLFKDNTAGVSGGDMTDLVLTWNRINDNIYNKLGLTHNQFQATYG
jgi:outer membrane murein-binding lipoprotein Lpp